MRAGKRLAYFQHGLGVWSWTFAFGRSVCFRIRPETLNYEGFREQAPNAEHPIKKKSAGEGNRTPVCSLGSCRSTIELHPRLRRSELRKLSRVNGDWGLVNSQYHATALLRGLL